MWERQHVCHSGRCFLPPLLADLAMIWRKCFFRQRRRPWLTETRYLACLAQVMACPTQPCGSSLHQLALKAVGEFRMLLIFWCQAFFPSTSFFKGATRACWQNLFLMIHGEYCSGEVHYLFQAHFTELTEQRWLPLTSDLGRAGSLPRGEDIQSF